jgi:hypothetical protein
MKLTCLIVSLFLSAAIFAQKIPASGIYTSTDGYYSITVNFKDKILTIVEPNKTSPYTLVAGNEFYYKNPTNGIEYLIEVVDATTLAMYKPTNRDNKYKFYFTGPAIKPADNEKFRIFSAVAKKFLEKMKEDPKDAQLWSFCAAAANARSSFNNDGFEEYLSKLVPSMKAILENKTKCPCTEAIDQAMFDRY